MLVYYLNWLRDLGWTWQKNFWTLLVLVFHRLNVAAIKFGFNRLYIDVVEFVWWTVSWSIFEAWAICFNVVDAIFVYGFLTLSIAWMVLIRISETLTWALHVHITSLIYQNFSVLLHLLRNFITWKSILFCVNSCRKTLDSLWLFFNELIWWSEWAGSTGSYTRLPLL